MSNVLIKGMEMPENCYDCKFECENLCCVIGRRTESLDRPEWCPLVPAVSLEDYQSMERTAYKLTQALASAPVKHGRWELKYHKLWGRNFPTCTVCGNPFYATKYCPNCGALMEAVKND